MDALQALARFLKLFRELTEAQQALNAARADLIEKEQLPVTLELEHKAVRTAEARVKEAWQKLEKFEHELDFATRQD